MIIEILVVGIQGMIIGIFSTLPNLPVMPAQIQLVLNNFNNFAQHTGQFLHFWYGDLLPTIILLSISVLLFSEVYKFTMFIIKKIPILHIS